ncbi:DUF389 domain-containing protein [Pannus brasiliensis CCIBt3594]|uniref:DUF389 domain-containing protein n=1 Tax=Pannus brasiliensis CCIBt3594 TaxID=1427578 RepID=A0AAW9QNY4_9CHRO
MYRFPFSRQKADPDRLQELQLDLLSESRFDSPYLVLIISSCAIATFGLLSNSAAVIIGAMIIAPLMMPIRGLAFGALAGDAVLFKKGVISVAIGTVVAIIISYSLGRIVGLSSYGSEVWARSAPTLLDLGVAVAAGGISGYAKVEPKISGSLAGTAIAVALMPPVCVVGLGLASGDTSLSVGATLLYLTNLLGIALSCMLAFLLTGYASFRRAKKVIISTFVFTAALVLPLGISFARLVQQAHLETSLRRALVDRTLTFQRLDLMNSETNWLTRPPEIRLHVRSREPLTPRQVTLLEKFIEREMNQKFTLIFEVGQVEEVRGENEGTKDGERTE